MACRGGDGIGTFPGQPLDFVPSAVNRLPAGSATFSLLRQREETGGGYAYCKVSRREENSRWRGFGTRGRRSRPGEGRGGEREDGTDQSNGGEGVLQRRLGFARFFFSSSPAEVIRGSLSI